jgi:large subunit ribosomal protein L24
MKAKIKRGDEVIVIAGKSKGIRGEVLRVIFADRGQTKVLVEGANLVKKHKRPNPQLNEPGGIQEREAYIDISNVMLINPSTGKGGRVGIRRLKDGKKTRYFRSNNEMLDAGN